MLKIILWLESQYKRIMMSDFYLLQSVRAISGVDQEISAEDFTDMVFEKIDINGDGTCLSVCLVYIYMCNKDDMNKVFVCIRCALYGGVYGRDPGG